MFILDAVDECELADQDQLCRLIADFEESTPDWLCLLATARADSSIVGRVNSEQRRLEKSELRSDVADQETVSDIKRYLRDTMSKFIDRISLDGALSQLAKNSEGNFLCASLLKV